MAAGVSLHSYRVKYNFVKPATFSTWGKENLALETDIIGRVQELLELIRSKYLSTPAKAVPWDLARKIQFFTIDVINLVGFGQAFGHLKAEANLNDYIRSGEEGLTAITFAASLGLIPILQWPPIARLLRPLKWIKRPWKNDGNRTRFDRLKAGSFYR
jgi:hypothetical protein